MSFQTRKTFVHLRQTNEDTLPLLKHNYHFDTLKSPERDGKTNPTVVEIF